MINGRWHQAMHMPKHATLEDRIKWHIVHTMLCHCRPMPEKIKKEIKRRKLHC